MKSIGNRLSEKYISKGIIEPQFKDAYAYIFDYFFSYAVYNVSLLFWGVLINHPLTAIVYIIMTGSIRAISGGYHCKTRISCFILSYAVFALYLFFTKNVLLLSTHILLFIYIISWTLILIISPVDTPNKPFNPAQKQKAQKRIFSFFIFNSIFSVFTRLFHWDKGLYFINLSLIICVVGLYAGYFSNRRQQLEP